MLEKIVKDSTQFKILKKEFRNGNFPTALLLSSEDEVYAFEFCQNLAALIFDGKACGECDNCLKVRAGAHPDLKVGPSKDKLSVADSEDIVMESFVKPIYATSKVFIIKNIDQAADVAQNKLLKILEEPPKNVYFLLTCASIDKVLPTIRSRCQKLQLARVDDNTILRLLPHGDEEEKSNVLAICDGQVGSALQLSQKADFQSMCQDCVSVFTKMKSSKQVLTYSKKLMQYKDDIYLCLKIMAVVTGDLFKIKAGKTELVRLKTFLYDMQQVVGEYTLRALCEISSLLDKVQKERIYNVNQTVAVENFLLNLLEVKYLCK